MSCIFACHAFARATGLLGPTGRVFLCCGPSPGHGVDPHRTREDPSIRGRWLACAMFVFPLREGRIAHRRGIGFVKGVGMSGIMGGVEWSGETGLPCVHVVCKERWTCFGGWCTCGENGWLGRRKRGCHASDSLTDLGLDGCWALSLVFAVAASFGCLVDTCSLPAAYTGIWYIAVMVLCGFCVFIFSPVVLRSFFSLCSCGSCIAVCLSDSLSAEA
jgi:hypothetical protein